ncbi:DUF4157 domain-containing protein [Streptomyces sp. NBC_00005]|uniref:eCIS core domain-containing protein n=1 Tax=Streptomyces sp. NBC_00005 TaxID=2903609 RepID=UPI003248B9BF
MGATGPDALLQLCRAGGNNAAGTLLQAKLKVSGPGDEREQEAERVAESIMQMPDDRSSGAGADEPLPVTPIQSGAVQGMCQRCAGTMPPPGGSAARPDEGGQGCHDCGEQVQRQADSAGPPAGGDELHRRVMSPPADGAPLTAHDRSFFEKRLGRDLSTVRVHTGAESSATAQALRARAFTVGNDVSFRSGEYAPGTPAGRRLLAHELTHVVQQGADGGGTHRVQRDAEEGPETSPEKGADNGAERGSEAASDGMWGARAVMYAATGNVVGLAGEVWLHLDRKHKEWFVDMALDGAATAVALLPADPAFGVLWSLFQAGLEGFVARLRSPKVSTAEKIRAMDKIAGIIAGRSMSFNLAFLKGLAMGFFLDGMLGIFILIRDLWRLLPRAFEVLRQAAHAIGGFPAEVERVVEGLKAFFLALNPASWVDQVASLARDPSALLAVLSRLVGVGRGFARDLGGQLAEALVRAFNAPGSEEALGDEAGKAVGQVLWEVVFAIATAGGGAAVTGAKAGLKAAIGVLGKLGGVIAHGFMAIFGRLHNLLGSVATWIRQAFSAAKGWLAKVGEHLARLLNELRALFARLLKSCHESKLVCEFPKRWNRALGVLKRWRSRTYSFGVNKILLTKERMLHFLVRHHPRYFATKVKGSQTYFDKGMSVEDIEDAVESVLRQNTKRLSAPGFVGRVYGNVGGVQYLATIDKGKVVQFFSFISRD